MNEKFKKKFEEKILIDKIKKIHKKIRILDANMGFLCNYCKAYSHLDGVYYFVPFTFQLRKDVENIDKAMCTLFDEQNLLEKKDCLLDNIEPINLPDFYLSKEDFED